MKFFFLSDLHLVWDNPVARTDNAHATQMLKFKTVLNHVAEERGMLFVAGDFFDHPRSWYLLPEIIRVLRKFACPVYSVFGQHDLYMYSENRRNTNLGILMESGLVHEIPKDGAPVINGVKVYPMNWGDPVPTKLSPDRNILVAHAPIAARAIYPGQQFSPALQFLKDHPEFDVIHVGDIHQRFSFNDGGRWIINTGPILRMEATDDSWAARPGFNVWESETGEMGWVEIPFEKPEKVLTFEHLEKAKRVEEMMTQFTTAIRSGTDVSGGNSFFEILQELMNKEGVGAEVREIISSKISETEK